MKSAYVICAILGMTISTLVLAQNGAVQATPIQVPKPSIPPSSAESSKNIADSGSNSVPTTTAEPSPNTHESTTLNKSTVISSTTTNAATTPATTSSTTAIPTETTVTTVTTPSTVPTIPTTPTSAPSPKPKPTSPAPEPSTAIPTNEAKTTPIPPSSKDRQFDGLSFFGGIVLTTCLMAIAAFSWRFYRQCKEGNYRTL